jgi:phosphoglycolate phosphatase
MEKYSLIIFDLDGTLLDTTEGVIEGVIYTIKRYNLPMCCDEILKTFVGPPMQESFMQVFNFDIDTSQEAANIFREYYKNNSVLHAKLYPGIKDFLGELKQRKYRIAIATYKRYDYTLKILNHFGLDNYCDSINGSDFENKRTKLDIINLCIKETNVTDLSQAVLIGDSKYDALGATDAGIDFIGVTYGFGFKTEKDVMQYKNIGYANNVEILRSYFIDV